MIIPNWNAPQNIIAFTALREDPPFSIPHPIKQVHGSSVIQLPYEGNATPEADAIFTETPDTLCAIRTADCLPILITNTQGSEVAAIHAGWKGLVAGIIEETFKRLQSAPQDCLAWIGPAICSKCFEVGPEVQAAFLAKDLRFNAAFVKGQHLKWLGNLPQIAVMILQDLGVFDISQSHICTIEDLRCNSYRREKGTDQRMITAISFTNPSSRPSS